MNNTDEEERHILQEHFNELYLLLVQNKLVPQAVFESHKDIRRCLSGIPVPYHNAVFGTPKNPYWDECIAEQIEYFKNANVPFLWYLNESASSKFHEKLSSHGFHDLGLFQGIITSLDRPILAPEIPSGSTLELVKDEKALDEFNEIACKVFDIEGVSREMYKKVLWNAMQSSEMFHWIARRNGKGVSVISTLISGDIVSFWNGATLVEFRRQGFNTALRKYALRDAKAKGCKIGISYMMPDGLAMGICTRLGFRPKWSFNSFLAPM